MMMVDCVVGGESVKMTLVANCSEEGKFAMELALIWWLRPSLSGLLRWKRRQSTVRESSNKAEMEEVVVGGSGAGP
jgi:hypothetical protein